MLRNAFYTHKLSIPRNEYLECFSSFLAKRISNGNTPWIFYQYDAAEKVEDKGGIGKTILLSEYRKIISEQFNDSFIIIEPIIDFIEIKNRTPMVMWNTLANSMKHLEGADFQRFKDLRSAFLASNNILYFKSAIDEYTKNIKTISEKLSKKLVFFFDTFEPVQDQMERLERGIPFPIPEIREYSVVIISSRNKPDLDSSNWKDRDEEIKSVPIKGFSNDEATSLFRASGIDLDSPPATVVNREFVQKLNAPEYANGRPILLALAIDFIKNRVLDINALLNLNPHNFRKEFIEHLNRFTSPHDFIIRLMAHVFNPWNVGMVKFFINEFREDSPDPEEIFTKLSNLSFIRRVGENELILHDEMRELVINYVWNSRDQNLQERKEVSQKAVIYFSDLSKSLDKKQKNVDRDREITLRQERDFLEALSWYHTIFWDSNQLMVFINREVNSVLDKGHFEKAELYLAMLDELKKRKGFSEPDWNRISIRQLRLYIGRYYLQQAEELALEISKQLLNQLERVKKGEDVYVSELGTTEKVTLLKVNKALGNIEHYLGQTYLYSNKYSLADEHFQAAGERYAYVLKNDPNDFHAKFLAGRNINWQGYNQIRQGLYIEALIFLKNAEQTLQDALNKLQTEKAKGEKTESYTEFLGNLEIEIKQWIAQVYGNNCIAYLNTDNHNEAENTGFFALQARRKLEMPVEVVKSLNSLGLVNQKKNSFDQALTYYQEAQTILREIQEPILMGRVYTNLGTTLIRRDAFSSLFYFSNIDSIFDEIKHIEESFRPKYEEGFNNLSEAVHILEDLGNRTSELANVYFNVGEYHMIKKEWNDAEKHLKLAIRIAEAISNHSIRYDALQRLLSLYYYSKMDVVSYRKTLDEIEKAKTTNSSPAIEHYPNYFMRYLLIQGNFIIDAYLKNSEFPLPSVSHDNALETAYRMYYEAAKAIFHRSIPLFNKIIELVDIHQRKRISVETHSKLITCMLEWVEEEKEDEMFYNRLRLNLGF